jgi:regulator of PEP synthase PpsR (kinase-PPPase family)
MTDIKTFHLHLVSDSTGETVSSVARSAMAQFEGVDADEHVWSLVRTRGQVDRAIDGIRENPGFVMYTIADKALRKILKNGCAELNVPCISVISRTINDLSNYLGIKTSAQYPGKQHDLDEDYFERIEAINYSLTHDDGQSAWDLDEAEIIVVGVSRTSKSPTSMYLAYRGFKTANVPYVKGVPLPDNLTKVRDPMIVALTISPDRLVQIRRNRLLSLHEEQETDYVDMEEVKKELIEAKRFFTLHGWPIIDVTRRSVEETAATIISQYYERKRKKEEA